MDFVIYTYVSAAFRRGTINNKMYYDHNAGVYTVGVTVVRFKPFPFCPKSSPSVPVNGPDGVIKHAQSLICRKARDSSVIVTELEQELPSTVIEQQNGSRQFSDRDSARARAT